MTRRSVFRSLHGYRRDWLTPDVLAAVVLLCIAVPEQLATSRLAGMPPVTGLYAFAAGTALFAALGSNPQLSVGADSTIAPLFAAGVARIATGGAVYQADVALLAVMIGILLAVVAIARLGWIADFLSAPIVTGFLAGVAVIIVVHQLPDLLGLPPVTGSTIHRITTIVTHLGEANAWSTAIGLVVLAVVAGAERIDRRIPGALVGLLGSTALVAAAGLEAHGVAVLGAIHTGLPSFGLDHVTWHTVARLAPLSAVVALVVLTQSAATTRAFADQGGYDTDIDRDLLGVGAGNVVAGLIGSFPVNASPARTGAVSEAGGRSQLAGLLAAGATLALLPALGWLRDLPVATLAAILLFVAARLFRWRDLAEILRFDRWEFALAVVTLLTVALVGVEAGIGVAVGLAVLDRTRISARPRSYVLGRIPGTTSWEPLGHHEHPAVVPHVVVFLFAAPLYFANAGYFRTQVHRALAEAATPTSVLVLDAAGFGDIDFTGARALARLLDEMDRSHIDVGMSRAIGPVPHNLAHSGLIERIRPDHIFHTVDEAVRTLAPGPDATGPATTGPDATGPTGRR